MQGQATCRSESLGGCSKPSRILRPFVNSFLREGYQKPTLGGLLYTVPLGPARRPYRKRLLFTRQRTVISARYEAVPRGFRKWSVTYRIGSVPRFAAV